MAATSKDHVAADLLRRAHPPETADTIFEERVKQRPLLLRPTSPDPQRDARAKRQYTRLQKEKAQRRSHKPKPLSAKQKRSLCIYDIPKEQQKYEIYVELHRMWCGYMRDILGLTDRKTAQIQAHVSGPILVSADYHGALVEVVRSRCVSRVGVKGIVVKDTKFTFEVVTKANVVKTVPKEHTIFQLELSMDQNEDEPAADHATPLVFEIYGNQLQTRAPDRANKKFRWHHDPDL